MRALLSLLALSLLLTAVFAITCYDCDSMHDPRCNEYFAPEGVKQVDCEDVPMPEYLQKYRRRLPSTGCLTKIHEGVDGQPLFIRRACFFGNPEDTREVCEAEDIYVPFADLISCQVCDEELCNTSAAPRSAQLWSVWLLLLSLLLSSATVFDF